MLMPSMPISPTTIAPAPVNIRNNCASTANSSMPSSSVPMMIQLYQAMSAPHAKFPAAAIIPVWAGCSQVELGSIELREQPLRRREPIAALEDARDLFPVHAGAVQTHAEPAARSDIGG